MSTPTPAPGWPHAVSPFHPGELAVQESLGLREQMDPNARRSIRELMPEQHRQFFSELPFLVIGGLDREGQPWASLRVGAPGFVDTPDNRTLQLAGKALPGDPLAGSWQVGSWFGGLGIQPATRRRNRVNGQVVAVDADRLSIKVSHSFGNCAKYIQSRTPTLIERGDISDAAVQEIATQLSDADRALLRRSDTFFIASANTSNEAGAGRGVDVSHRGGRPGFIRVDADGTLTVPDFSGNRYFNTLGNLLLDPRAGLLVLDFASGDVLYLAARAEIIWEGEEVAAYPGAQRLLRLHVEQVRRSPQALPFVWSEVDYAPQLAADAAWQKPAASNTWRTLQVSEVHDETATVRSFHLQSLDGSTLPDFEPGQFLPIRIAPDTLPDSSPSLLRTYTLSDASHGRHYRITVKREGHVSNWLHTHLRPGMLLEAQTPRGGFTLDRTSPRPVVLLSAGVGITPMMAMLNSLLSRETARAPVYFVHGARAADDHPFATQLALLAEQHAELHVDFLDSQGPPASVKAMQTVAATPVSGARVQHHRGRIDIDFLKRILPFGDYDFYLCGPAAFMQQLYQGLRELNISDARIRFEAFGPASVVRSPSAEDQAAPAAKPAVAESARVVFARSQKSATWSVASGTLLELAEAQGIQAEFSCRSGTCGSCATRVLGGSLTYPFAPSAEPGAGHTLLCCALPAVDSADTPITLDL